MKFHTTFIATTIFAVLQLASGDALAINDDSKPKDKKYNEITEKYRLTDPNNKRTSQSRYHKLKENNFYKNQPVGNPNLEQEVIQKYFIDREPSDPNEALSNVEAIDFDANYRKSINQAKQIAGKRSMGQFNAETNTFEAEYYQNGVNTLKRNEDGKLIIVEKPESERGELISDGLEAEQLVGNEINHEDQQAGGDAEFTAKDAAGSDIKVRGSVRDSVSYVRQQNSGTGLMAVDAFKAVVKGQEENRMNMSQDDPLFNASYTAIRNADEDFYGDCEERVEVIEVTETFPGNSIHQCGIAKSMGPSFCEVRREVVDQQPMTFFTANYDSKQDWPNAVHNIKGKKHSGTFESGHWDTVDADLNDLVRLGGGTAEKSTHVDSGLGIYTEEIDFRFGITGAAAKTSRLGRTYNARADINMLYNFKPASDVISAKLVLGATGEVRYGHTSNTQKADDKAEVAFVLNRKDVTAEYADREYSTSGKKTEVVQNEDGSTEYTHIYVMKRYLNPICARPGHDANVECEAVWYEVTHAERETIIAYEMDNGSREIDITEDFAKYFVNRGRNLEIEIEIYADIVLEEFRTQHKESQPNYRRQYGPYGRDRDESWYSSWVYENSPPAVSLVIEQPEFKVTTITEYYPEGCFEKTQGPEAACSFDGTWNVIEEGTRGYNIYILDNMLPLFEGDTGYKTWVAEANNYSCGPFSGGSVTVDGESYTWDDVVANSEGCEALEADIQCHVIETDCEYYNPEDPQECILESRVYECEDNYSVTREIEQITNTCDMELPCTGGDCETSAPETNDSFDEAMVQLSIAQSVQDARACANEADPESCVIFGGEARQCRYEKTFSLGNDCCAVPEGTDPVALISATWQMSKASGLNDYVYDAAASSWESATTVLADSSVGQSVSNAWDATSTALTNVYDSIAGNATREVATDAGNQALSEATEAGVMEGLKSQTYEVVYNALPEDLANLIFDETKAQTQDYALSAASEEVLSYVDFIADAYSYYAYFKLALNLLTQCNANEDSPEFDANMGLLIGNKQCSYVERKSFPGNPLLRRQLHCCFDSALARIVMEQAYPQMGYATKSDYFEAGCPGMSPDEMSQLDWELIDLSEWLGLMDQAGILKSDTNEDMLTGNGRLLNQGNRQTATERTLERLNSGDTILERQKQVKRDVKPKNVDCSITPRPAICDYSESGILDSGGN